MTEIVINDSTPKITKKDLNRVYYRIHLMNLTMNYQQSQGIGFYTAMVPILERLYQDSSPEVKQAANERHLTYFLTQTTAAGMILGLVGAVEETTPEESKTEAVAGIKTGMMGPLAGIGDSLFKITLQAITGSIGAVLALQGNIIGPILMFVLFVGINEGIKYYGIHKSYELGMTVLGGSEGSQFIDRLVRAAGVLGLTVIGSLIASSVKFSIGSVIKVKDTQIVIQDLFDSFMPLVLPLLFTVGLYFLFRKLDRKYIAVVIFVILILGTVLAMLGVLA